MKGITAQEFMEQQWGVAERIAEALGIEKFDITYVEFIPFLSWHSEIGKICQRQLPDSEMVEGVRHKRIKVHIHLDREISEDEIKKLNPIMCRNFKVKGQEIIYGRKPFR